MEKTDNAARLVSGALLGLDYRAVMIGGRRYIIEPPTIKKLCGAAYHLAEAEEAQTIADLVRSQKSLRGAAAALSWLVKGDDSLTETFAAATLEEVVTALGEAYQLASANPFLMLSLLAKNAAKTIAKQKQ